MTATQAQLDREVSCSRSYLIALQYIAEMVGLDTTEAPPEGVWSVVAAVDAFVKHAGGGVCLHEAQARCGEHWINEQLARDPAISAHERAARAYYAALETPDV